MVNTESLFKLAKEQLALARRELDRQQSLASKKIITDSELDQAKRDELTAINAALTLSNQRQLLNTRRNRLESCATCASRNWRKLSSIYGARRLPHRSTA